MSNDYLEVRVAFALARIASISDPDHDGFEQVMTDAQVLACRDGAFYTAVPLYFADEPFLANAWKSGLSTTEEIYEPDFSSRDYDEI